MYIQHTGYYRHFVIFVIGTTKLSKVVVFRHKNIHYLNRSNDLNIKSSKLNFYTCILKIEKFTDLWNFCHKKFVKNLNFVLIPILINLKAHLLELL